MRTTEQTTGTVRIATNTLDHVALWTADRDAIADLVCDHMGLHVIERTDKFTLVGADARLGKLTLFEAEGPRDPGLLSRVVLGVSDLEGALAKLPGDLAVERPEPGLAVFGGPEGLGLGLREVESPQVEYDLESVVLRVPDPERTYEGLEPLGFERDPGEGLAIKEKRLLLEAGDPGHSERPLLNHIAMLVDSAEGTREQAERRGVEVADFVDAANTWAVFLWGPDRIKLEYVEHKPGFALV
jgi:catechol 2,3-dioxygenase-like lactoylglutathione lyase family enzyme